MFLKKRRKISAEKAPREILMDSESEDESNALCTEFDDRHIVNGPDYAETRCRWRS